jgi:hypothetical protein
MNRLIGITSTHHLIHLLRHKYVAILALSVLCLSNLNGQQPPIQTPDANQLTYFDYLFARLANLDTNQMDLQRRQFAFANRLSLSTQEREALAKSLAIYSNGLKGLRDTVASMTNGNTKPVGLDKSQTDSLASQRLSIVNIAATTFISSLSPLSKSRLDSISHPHNRQLSN